MTAPTMGPPATQFGHAAAGAIAPHELQGAAGAAQDEQVEPDEQDEPEEPQDPQPFLPRAETVSALAKQTMAVTAPISSNFRILSSFIERCNGKPPLVHDGQTEYSLQFINS